MLRQQQSEVCLYHCQEVFFLKTKAYLSWKKHLAHFFENIEKNIENIENIENCFSILPFVEAKIDNQDCKFVIFNSWGIKQIEISIGNFWF